MKLTVSRDDVFYYHVRTEEETKDLFGQDYFDDYNVDIPEDIAKEFLAATEQWQKAQDKLSLYLKSIGRD